MKNVKTLSCLLTLGIVLMTLEAMAAAVVLEVVTPSGGEVYVVGQVQTVRVLTKLKSVLIELSRDGGTTFSSLGTIDNTVKNFALRNKLSFTVSGPESNNCVIRATAQGKTQVSAVSGAFSIVAGFGGAVSPGVTADQIASGAASSGALLTANGLGGAAFLLPGITDWSLTGNAGTVPGTNFLGTTDNQPLQIRTNNTTMATVGIDFSLAAGRRTTASHVGAFVWGDSTNADFTSTAINQFAIRAANGVRLATNAGSTKAVNVGELYRDNVVLAWGIVTATGVVFGDSSYGVSAVTRDSAGVYTVTLTTPTSSFPNVVAVAEVDAPPTNAATTRIVSADSNASNGFRVFINDGNFAAVDNDFMFIVTAR